MVSSAAVTDRNISKFDDNKRGLAKLMAKENITVQILDGVPTATFDVVTRVLTLPNWPFANVDTLDTLIGHEIGHALYTDHSYIERFIAKRQQRNKRLFSYVNVVEDARIERKVRDAYPGMKGVFYHGYEYFTKNGPVLKMADRKRLLFDDKKVAIATLPFIDRINIYYKIGAFVDVPFAADEAVWIDRINRCFSTTNACEIAEALYKLAREKAQQEQQAPSGEKGDKSEGKSKSEKGDKGDEKDAPKDKKSKGDKRDEGDTDDDDAAEEKGSKGEDEGTEGDSATDDAAGGESSDEDGADDATGGESGGDTGGDGDASAGDAAGDDGTDGDGGEDGGMDSGDGDAESESGKPSGDPASNQRANGSDANTPDVEESVTDKALREGLQKLVEEHANPAQSIKHLLLHPLPADAVKKRTTTVEQWLSENRRTLASEDARLTAAEAEWKTKFLATAQHMSAEFLRRRTAKNLQHARVGRSGRLDMNRLPSYSFADDLFKRVTIVPNGQSHGIVMMIDGSSSMMSVFADVLDQVMLFATFAFQCAIPFEAYMFTDEHVDDKHTIHMGNNTVTVPDSCGLVQLIDTTTNRRGFRQQMRLVLALQQRMGVTRSSLGDTPLYGGLMLMERHVERMKRLLRLDKVIAVVISDGGDTDGLQMESQTVNVLGKVVTEMSGLSDRSMYGSRGSFGVVLRDSVTKRNFMCVEKNGTGYSVPRAAFLTMFFDVMKARHDARGIYMFLVKGKGNAIFAANSMVRAGAPEVFTQTEVERAMDKTAQYTVPNACTDCGIVQLTMALKIDGSRFAEVQTAGMTAAEIGQRYIEHNRKAQKNRVFINTVMPFIA